MLSTKPLTSVEAFALALVEASSRLEVPVASDGGEAGAHDEDAAPAAE